MNSMGKDGFAPMMLDRCRFDVYQDEEYDVWQLFPGE